MGRSSIVSLAEIQKSLAAALRYGFHLRPRRQHLFNLVDISLVVKLNGFKEGPERSRFTYKLSSGVDGRAASVLTGSNWEMAVISY